MKKSPENVERLNKQLKIKRQKEMKQSWYKTMKTSMPNFTKRGYRMETVIKFN
jgi:hypothetical protein